jgi:SAM-dependent methyltransferase
VVALSKSTVASRKSADLLHEYLSGNILYGDDFSQEEIEEWYRDEEEGYGSLVNDAGKEYRYAYRGMDEKYAFKYLPEKMRMMNALGIGSAYGDEFWPIMDRLSHVTIIEPSAKFVHNDLGGLPLSYVKPAVNGTIPFRAEYFDLVVCFSAVHHIPNVAHILAEMFRVVKKHGYVLLREPIVSMREPIHTMEDWTKPRRGLTKRERGIPLQYLRRTTAKIGFKVVNEQVCGLATTIISKLLSIPVYDSNMALFIDRLMCLICRSRRYHSYSNLHKVRPSMVVYVVSKG